MNTEMTLSEVVELSAIENYNFAREMVDFGKWTKQDMKEYLESKLNIITEIEIEANIDAEKSDDNSELKADLMRVVNNANVYANSRATTWGVGATQGLKRFSYSNWLRAFEAYLFDANYASYSLVSDRIEHLQQLAQSKDTKNAYK